MLTIGNHSCKPTCYEPCWGFITYLLYSCNHGSTLLGAHLAIHGCPTPSRGELQVCRQREFDLSRRQTELTMTLGGKGYHGRGRGRWFMVVNIGQWWLMIAYHSLLSLIWLVLVHDGGYKQWLVIGDDNQPSKKCYWPYLWVLIRTCIHICVQSWKYNSYTHLHVSSICASMHVNNLAMICFGGSLCDM